MTTTPIRSKAGHIVHVTEDARRTLCNRTCDGWAIEDILPTCKRCMAALKTRLLVDGTKALVELEGK